MMRAGDVADAAEDGVRGIPEVANGRLRLGIDGDALRAPLSGVGSYVLRLCRELENLLPDAMLFAYSRFPAAQLVLPSARWHVRSEPHVGLRRLPSFVWLKTRGAAFCARDRLHVFWAGRTLHPRLKGPTVTVCTVHDLNHVLVPETMQSSTLWSHRLWFERDVALANLVVANSRGTAQRMNDLLALSADAIITPGLDASFRPPSHEENLLALAELGAMGVHPPYVLSVSTLEPRKNIGTLIDAFIELRQVGQLSSHSLVLVGANGWMGKTLASKVTNASGHRIVQTGYVPGRLLPALYANAEVFVLPSLYEGFGMPVLEARACGTRVVVSDTPELREVGGPHATIVEPTVAGVRAGIERAISSSRAPELALAEEFAWSRAAKRLATIFVSSCKTQGGRHEHTGA
jgi:glycosyltransferase involved in cell wall biosynthesis